MPHKTSIILLVASSLLIFACSSIEPTVTPTAVVPPTATAALTPTSTAGIGTEDPLTIAAICSTQLNQIQPPTGDVEFGDFEYHAIFETTKGTIRAELFPATAPLYVENFVRLACNGFYDGVSFHRVVENFVSQGGDPTGTGSGGPGYTFADLFHPAMKHDAPGILSMANSGLHSNGSQFFITHSRTPHLDAYDAAGEHKLCEGQGVSCHGVFGKVYDGLNVVTSLEEGDLMNSVKIFTRPLSQPVEKIASPYGGPFPTDNELRATEVCTQLPMDPEAPLNDVDFTGEDYAALLTTSRGIIRAILFDDKSPIVTEAFMRLACQGHFDDAEFRVQTLGQFGTSPIWGDTTIDAIGGSEYPFEQRFAKELRHSRRGVVSATRLFANENSATAFLITKNPLTPLDPYLLNGQEWECDNSQVMCHSILGYVYEGHNTYDGLMDGDSITSVVIMAYSPTDGD